MINGESSRTLLRLQPYRGESERMAILEPEQLGQRIRQARERLGLSQEELAALISRDQRSVSEYENGKRRIYAHDLPTIARALNVPLIYFYEEVLSEDDLEATLLMEFRRLNVDARKTLIEMTKLLEALLDSEK